MEAWKRWPAEPDLVWPTERVSAPMVAEELASADPPLLLDIRNPREWAARHIDGSVNIPLNHLQERIAEIPRDRRIAVHCAGGYRSSIAASILHQYGITHLIEMAGGLAAWEAAKLPVVSYLSASAYCYWAFLTISTQTPRRSIVSLRINDTAPDFSAETTQGAINFHEWIGDGWAILFSHPKDFTPVCTTELGYMAGLQPEFAKRNCKIIGLSVDPVTSHGKWAEDIEETQGHSVNYPMIGDPELKVAKLYDMLPADAGDYFRGPHRGHQRHGAHGVRDRAGQEDQADAQLPHEHGPQFRRSVARTRFHSAHGRAQGCHSGELEARRRCDHRAGRIGRGSQTEIPRRLEGAQALSSARPAAEVVIPR